MTFRTYTTPGDTTRENAEVLKRAGLVMALTAWETYVEDRLREEVAARLRVVNGSYVGNFVLSRLEEELRRFHNPTSDKTRKLFHDFLEVDVTTTWEWQHYDKVKAKKTLDELLAKRGDAVHRSRPSSAGHPRCRRGRMFVPPGRWVTAWRHPRPTAGWCNIAGVGDRP